MKRLRWIRLLPSRLIFALAFATLLIAPSSSLAAQTGPVGPAGPSAPANTATDNQGNTITPVFNWVNEGTLTAAIGSTTLSFSDPSAVQDHTTDRAPYKFQALSSCSESDIWADSAQPGKISHGYIYYQSSANGACVQYNLPSDSSTIAGSTGNASIVYTLSNDGKTINRIDGPNAYTFSQSTSDPTIFVESGGNCADTIVKDSNGNGTLWQLAAPGDASATAKNAPSGIGANNCYISSLTDDMNGPALNGAQAAGNGNQCGDNLGEVCSNYKANSNGSFTVKLGNAANATPLGQGSAATGNDATCSAGSLSWLICPIVSVGEAAIVKLESFIQALLQTTPLLTNSPTYTAWVSFRNLADIMFVLVFFAMIFGNALGVDSYTVKKVLPKLVAASVLVQFSFFLMQVGVDISNVLGSGIAGLFPHIFNTGSTPNTTGQLVGGGLEIGGMAALTTIGALAAPEVAGALVVPVLLTLLAGVMGIIATFITLEARQILIEVLTLLSPVAFAAWILPNTARLFKLWWSNILKLLLMYPLIMLLIAAGNLVSAIPADLGDNTIKQLLTAFIPIIVFFMIPATFKMSGGLMSMVSGAIAKRSANAASRIRGSELLKNAKANVAKKALYDYENNANRLEKFGRFGNNKAVQGLANRAGKGFSRVAAGQTFAFGPEGKTRLRRAVTNATNELVKERMESLQPFMMSNDQANQIAQFGGGEFENFTDSQGNKDPLTDRNGVKKKLKMDNITRAAALRMVADGGGSLEMADYFDKVYDRTPTAANPRGSWRTKALGNVAADNQQIWFGAFGPHAASLITALRHTNPGKGVTNYDTEGPEDMASGHQQSAYPRVQQDAYGDLGPTNDPQRYADRHQGRSDNLRQIWVDPRRHNIDRKILLAQRLTAAEHRNEKEVVNGVEVDGEQLRLSMISPQGTINEIPKTEGTLPPEVPIQASDFEKDKESKEFYTEYRRRSALWNADQAAGKQVDPKFRIPPPNFGAKVDGVRQNRRPDEDAQRAANDQLNDPYYDYNIAGLPTPAGYTNPVVPPNLPPPGPAGGPTPPPPPPASPNPSPNPAPSPASPAAPVYGPPAPAPQYGPPAPTVPVVAPATTPVTIPTTTSDVTAPVTPGTIITPTTAPSSASPGVGSFLDNRRPGSPVRPVNQTNAAGQLPLEYERLNETTGRWETITQGAYQNLQAAYGNEPEKLNTIRSVRRTNR
jgi:hypothetical protein